MLFFLNAIWPLLSRILQHLDLIKESYIIRGSGLENTWKRQKADTQGRPSVWSVGERGTVPNMETDAGNFMWRDEAFVRKERASHCFFASTGCEEIQGSLSIFLSSSCPIPQINGQSPKGSIAHACLWIETPKRSHSPTPKPSSQFPIQADVKTDSQCTNAKFLASFHSELCSSTLKMITAYKAKVAECT